jgi:hypothetical protein
LWRIIVFHLGMTCWFFCFLFNFREENCHIGSWWKRWRSENLPSICCQITVIFSVPHKIIIWRTCRNVKVNIEVSDLNKLCNWIIRSFCSSV